MKITLTKTIHTNCLALLLVGLLTLFAAGLLLPTVSQAQPEAAKKTKASQKKAGPITTYECPMCHERVTAAQAQKQHMLCACCKDKLVPVKTASTGITKK